MDVDKFKSVSDEEQSTTGPEKAVPFIVKTFFLHLDEILTKGLNDYPRPIGRKLIVDRSLKEGHVTVYWSDKPDDPMCSGVEYSLWLMYMEHLLNVAPNKKSNQFPIGSEIDRLFGIDIIVREEEHDE